MREASRRVLGMRHFDVQLVSARPLIIGMFPGHGGSDSMLEVFAVVREASRRVLGMRHFDVQLVSFFRIFTCHPLWHYGVDGAGGHC